MHTKKFLSYLNAGLDELERSDSDRISGPQQPHVPTHIDPLSGLLTHAEFQKTLVHHFELAKKRKSSVACLLANIDHFHAINRRFGYDFGDEAIRQIADILRLFAPRSAEIARFAGEEFALIWPDSSYDEAIAIAENIRTAIANHRFSYKDQSTYLTVSLGLSLSDENTHSEAVLLSTAQLVLRAAKREGRNRICYWKRELPKQTEADMVSKYNVLQDKLTALGREMKAVSNAEVRSLLSDIDIPDGLSNDHAENVAFIAATIADELRLPEEEIDTIISAALLHDIGKLGIDKNILSKEGKLTREEFNEIKKHPLLGVEFLNDARFFENELPLILHHHEHYDGTGYPDGLAGDEIPLGARIISLAEAIDGLLSGSTYREAMSITEVINELRRCAGTQFDPYLTRVAIKLLECGRIG